MIASVRLVFSQSYESIKVFINSSQTALSVSVLVIRFFVQELLVHTGCSSRDGGVGGVRQSASFSLICTSPSSSCSLIQARPSF